MWVKNLLALNEEEAVRADGVQRIHGFQVHLAHGRVSNSLALREARKQMFLAAKRR